MSAGTEPARWSQPLAGSEGAALEWLDALASGDCTPEAFMGAMRAQFQKNPDEGWEVLSLLDQYYRRGRIKAEVFQAVKHRLEGSALKGEKEAAVSAATLRVRAAAASAATAPPAPPAPSSPSAASAPPVPVAAVPQKKTAPDAPTAGREVAIGDVLRGRYRIRGMLGRGAKSTVFEALDDFRLDLPTMGQRLAIKVLNAGVTQRQDLLAELQQEFQYLQLLSHPNIVRVHEFDRDGDVAFFTMELLNGALLSRVLSARNGIALPRAYALAVIRDVGAALAHAHSRGVVHGDINPQNILITSEGELRVLDFSASHKMLPDSWSTDHELSQRAPVATPAYASCQLLDGQQPDARDDLFALACVAYTLLSGRHPFPNRTAVDARAEGFRPRQPPELTGRQWRILREGLRWERERRPANVQKWLDRFKLAGAASRLPALPVLVGTPPPRRPKIAFAATAAVAIALLAGGAYWASTDYDSLKRHVSGWNGQFRSAFDETTASAPAERGPDAISRAPHPAATREASRPPVTRATPPPATAPSAGPAPLTGSAPPPGATSAASPNPTSAPAPALRSQAPAQEPAAPRSSTVEAARTYAGPIRVEMAADTVDVQPGDTVARVVVRRRGNPRGDASFTWWTESGTAKPERDFAPVMPRAEHIEDGSGSVILNIPVSDRPRTDQKSFYVVIDRTDSGAALGARTLTMVTLQPPG